VSKLVGYIPDREGQQLTSHPQMKRALPPPVSQESIFGDTWGGVPNPLVPVRHGYPTRYHGPIFNVPQPAHRYIERPYQKVPFWGVEDTEVGGIRVSPTKALIGGLLGYLGAPTREDALTYVGAGAVAGGLGGWMGIAGLLGIQLYQAQQKGNLRKDLRGAI